MSEMKDLLKEHGQQLKKEKDERDKRIIKLRESGLTIVSIAGYLGTSKSTIARVLKRNREK